MAADMTYVEQIVRASMVKIKVRSVCELAERIGISRNTFCRRMERPDKMTLHELALVDNKVHMTDEQIAEIVRSTLGGEKWRRS